MNQVQRIFLTIILTTIAGAYAWLFRFAVKEYGVFKKLKIPFKIFWNGGIGLTFLLIWQIGTYIVYSKALTLIPKDKANEFNETIKNILLIPDKNGPYYLIATWFIIWASVFVIDELAKAINNAREDEKGK